MHKICKNLTVDFCLGTLCKTFMAIIYTPNLLGIVVFHLFCSLIGLCKEDCILLLFKLSIIAGSHVKVSLISVEI